MLVVFNLEVGYVNDVVLLFFLFDISSVFVCVLIDKLRFFFCYDLCDEEEFSSFIIWLVYVVIGCLKEVIIVLGNVRYCGRVIENGVEVYFVVEFIDLI